LVAEKAELKENIQELFIPSHRKHGKYIAVNCGAIPEGTIDSELFGHEKGLYWSNRHS
jgi:transcriptional regulator with PAS, ATPase and Fis domain